MFSRISFKSQPDHFSIALGFSQRGRTEGTRGERRKVLVEWTSAESEATVLTRLQAAVQDPSLIDENVKAALSAPVDSEPRFGVIAASTFQKDVQLVLEIHSTQPTLETIELLRTSSGSSGITAALSHAIWSAVELSYVQRIRCTDGFSGLFDKEIASQLTSLKVLNLSHCGLGTLPGVVGMIQGLEELRLVGNRLKMLPAELGLLSNLRIFTADSNEILILPGDLRHCTKLEELSLENNRLTSVLLNFGSFQKLQVLHLYNNPLEFLPEISPCHSLRHLSVANMRVTADPSYSKFKVELLPATAQSGGSSMGISLFDSGKQQDKLRPIFSLMLRRSSGHHPLLAGALRQIAEQEPKNCELMARQENALQQLVLMALNDNPTVVEQTCATLCLLATHSTSLAEVMVDNDVGSVLSLIPSHEERVQLASLRVLAAIAIQSSVAAGKVLTEDVLASLEELVMASPRSVSPRLKAGALEALGNLSFAYHNRSRIQMRQGLMQQVLDIAQQQLPWNEGPGRQLDDAEQVRVTSAAVRVLAILGENDAVWRAIRRRPLIGRKGVRILSMDGGGMKGIATVHLLRQLEMRTGKRVQDMFDLICGTSTGGLLAVALGLCSYTLDECEEIYKVVGQKVFSKALAKDKEETWMESFYRTFHSKTQHVRAVVVGYKHDATVYEGLLKEFCDFSKEPRCLADSMIDTACLNAPKVALVSTMASVSPAQPFVFRNYEIPPARDAMMRQVLAHGGSSKFRVWQAVRASSAATYYLDDYIHDGDKYQDGAIVANNPAIIALQEARLLWPDAPIEVLVSMGTGSTPPVRRSAAVSSFMETGSILIESACGVDRPAEALATLLPLVPDVQYFRFTPTDPRCGMELDEVDPFKWEQLEAATEDYISTVGEEFDLAAHALMKDLEPVSEPSTPAAPAMPSPDSVLAGLKLGPSRHLLLIASPAPAVGLSSAPPCPDLAAVFPKVIDVGRREASRRRLPPWIPTLGLPSRPPASRPQAPHPSGGSLPTEAAPSGTRQARCSLPSRSGAAGASPGREVSPRDCAPEVSPRRATEGQESAAVAAPDREASAGAGAATQSGRQEDAGGGGWLSWFSPRKHHSSDEAPTQAGPAHSLQGAAAVGSAAGQAEQGESEPPEVSPMQRSLSSTFQAVGKLPPVAAALRSSQAGPGSSKPDRAFLSIKLGGRPKAVPAQDPAPPASTGVRPTAALAAAAVALGGRDGHAEPASSAEDASPEPSFDASSAAAAVGGDGAGCSGSSDVSEPHGRPLQQPWRQGPALGSCEHSGPAAFLAAQLSGMAEGESGEVGACHLALDPAGDGLVLSWQQAVEAVVEPSTAARTLLLELGQDQEGSLSEVFWQRPSLPLPPCAKAGGRRPGGSLALLTRQEQWVGGSQLAVLLLQTTTVDCLLTADLVEDQLRGVLAQQLVTTTCPLPRRLLLALLGAGGASAVVCPRAETHTPGEHSRHSSSSESEQGQEAGMCALGERAGQGVQQVMEGEGRRDNEEEGGSDEAGGHCLFFLAFYSALKGGATVMQALRSAEAAQPQLAGVYGVHGVHDGMLLQLP